MNGFQRCPRHPVAFLLASLLAIQGAAAETMPLNDTGMAQCYDGSGLVVCSAANTGDSATYPRQDGRFGRDAAARAGAQPKTGGGAAGFDFTRVCMSGQLAGQGTCPANPIQGTGANEWACTKDNVTNLIWSLESGYGNWFYAITTYPAAMNVTSRCGSNTGWRAPTTRELLSIIHNGVPSPAIDVSYFPATYSGRYWSADVFVSTWWKGLSWIVSFGDGLVDTYSQGFDAGVRLVFSGQ